MRRPVPFAVALTLTLALAVVPGRAGADWFRGAPLGAAGVTQAASVDLARDGTGGAAWVGGGRVLFSALAGGGFTPPAAVSPGAPGGGAPGGAARTASAPVLAAGHGGALAVAWNAGGRIYAAYRPPGAARFRAPALLWPGGAPAGPPALDVAGREKGLLAFGAGGDVHAAALLGGRWRKVPGVLDVDASADAGSGDARPAVTMSSDGTGLVAWGEGGRIEVRRVRGVARSVASTEAGAGDRPLLGTGDDDSYALVSWRSGALQYARRLRGGAFDSAAPAIAGGGDAALAVNGRGAGLYVAAGAGGAGGEGGPVTAAPLAGGEVVRAAVPLAPAGVRVAAAAAEHVYGFAGWLTATGVSGVRRTLSVFAPPVSLLDPALGAPSTAGGLTAAADGTGDLLLAWIQTAPAAGSAPRLVVGGFDRPPTPPAGLGPRGWQAASRPVLRWTASGDPWLRRYEVTVDGRPAGRTTGTAFRLPRALADGGHPWRVVALDAHGQRTASGPGRLLVDTRPPVVAVAFTAVGGRGSRVRVRVRVRDGGGSGLASSAVRWGDGARSSGTDVTHVLSRPGTSVVRVVARDQAGNVARVRRSVKIRSDSKAPS